MNEINKDEIIIDTDNQNIRYRKMRSDRFSALRQMNLSRLNLLFRELDDQFPRHKRKEKRALKKKASLL